MPADWSALGPLGTRAHRWFACSRKKGRWSSLIPAEKRAKELGMRAYWCRYCSGWHLTRKPLEQAERDGDRG